MHKYYQVIDQYHSLYRKGIFLTTCCVSSIYIIVLAPMYTKIKCNGRVIEKGDMSTYSLWSTTYKITIDQG